jgi:hypothetical protein
MAEETQKQVNTKTPEQFKGVLGNIIVDALINAMSTIIPGAILPPNFKETVLKQILDDVANDIQDDTDKNNVTEEPPLSEAIRTFDTAPTRPQSTPTRTTSNDTSNLQTPAITKTPTGEQTAETTNPNENQPTQEGQESPEGDETEPNKENEGGEEDTGEEENETESNKENEGGEENNEQTPPETRPTDEGQPNQQSTQQPQPTNQPENGLLNEKRKAMISAKSSQLGAQKGKQIAQDMKECHFKGFAYAIMIAVFIDILDLILEIFTLGTVGTLIMDFIIKPFAYTALWYILLQQGNVVTRLLRKQIVKRFVAPIVLEMIPIIAVLPISTIMVIWLQITLYKERQKLNKDLDVWKKNQQKGKLINKNRANRRIEQPKSIEQSGQNTQNNGIMPPNKPSQPSPTKT